MDRKERAKSTPLGKMGSNSQTKNTGRLGSKKPFPLCKGIGCKSRVEAHFNLEPMDGSHHPKIHNTNSSSGLDQRHGQYKPAKWLNHLESIMQRPPTHPRRACLEIRGWYKCQNWCRSMARMLTKSLTPNSIIATDTSERVFPPKPNR